MFDLYEVGVRCWLPDDKEGWVGAEVLEKSNNNDVYTLKLKLEDGTETEVELSDKTAPPLRNPPVLESTEDLTTLSYLNEPAVLHAIKTRYAQLSIYTFSGIVLIATNPFDRVDNLYTPEVIQTYSGRQRGELEPHLFSIAEDAFRCMVREGKNQTIVVSGESGAGKTVSAKFIMRYFATVDDPEHPRKTLKGGSELSDVEREILASNPIMEAFGNAKTTRNDNSSRFGKYLEIRFNKDQEIVGALIRTYLLERSRIVFHAPKERNYHIFYQLVAGATPEERERLSIPAVSEFAYLNQGDTTVDGVDDVKEFKATRDALEVVGIVGSQQQAIFEILAALLHLGNIVIKPGRSSVSVASDDPALVKACELLGIPANELARWLTKKQVIMRSEKIVSDLDHKTATTVRDSVAKLVYTTLFDWLVTAVNNKLTGEEAASTFIGVLDIYGFEHFKKNSFEQFCINYANEKLQQEFNQHVFKLEQEEYQSEEINWNYIDFSDNQPCINLIENKLGILSLLDEESRLPAGSDDGFVSKLYSSFDNPQQPYFSKPRFGQSAFVVKHYAMEVNYETEGFIEKNRDTMPETILDTLKNTTNTFLKEILDKSAEQQKSVEDAQAAVAPAKPGPKLKSARKPTLGNIFKTSLIELMATIDSTNVHYIRCIKPNEEKKAWKFDGPMVLSQLRACGVLETIRISSAGFPSRWSYEDFAERYEMLLKSSQRESNDPRVLCQSIINVSIKDEDKYQLGKTKIFFRAGMLAQLEKLRSNRLKWGAVKIQSMLRMQYYRQKFTQTIASVTALQTLLRGFAARKRVQDYRESTAATRLQAQFRGNAQRAKFDDTISSVRLLQAAVRGFKARQGMYEARKSEFILEIQSIIRGYNVRKEHKKNVNGIILAQTLTRRRFARRELTKLREERNSVKHFEEAQYRLENKVVQLQNSVSEHKESSKQLAAQLAALQSDHDALQNTHKEAQDTHQKAIGAHLEDINTHKSAVENLKAELASHQEELSKSTTAHSSALEIISSKDAIIEELKVQITNLENELSEAKERATNAEARAANAPRQVMMTGAGLHPNGPGGMDQTAQRSLYAETDHHAHPADDSSINAEIEHMLNESPGAKEELVNTLIRNLQVPTPKTTSTNEALQQKDVLYPSNMVNMMISEMWRLGYVQESEKLIGSILKLIQETVGKYSGDKIIPVGAFWMSNVHEIYSFICLAEVNICQNPVLRHEMTTVELSQYERLMNLAKRDAEAVTFNIYHIWLKEIKKLIDKMIVPAVVDEQSIPGFQVEEQTRFLPKMFSSGHEYKMNDLLLLLTKVHTSMKAFYLEEGYMRQPILELLTMIGAKAFNDMIMRKTFLSWKRAVQINYNVTRIEEWCKGHGMPEGALPLDRLMQSAKLLQLKKNLDSDVNIIYDICWALTPIQIQRLIVNYHLSDYEAPITDSVLEFVAKKCREDTDSSTRLLLDVRPVGDSGPFEMAPPRVLKKIEPYIPADLDVPKLRHLTEATAKASRINEDQLELMDEAQSEQVEGVAA